MRLLDRYIGRQLLITAIFAIAVLSVVLVVAKIFKDLLELLVNQNVPASLVLSVIGYVIPFSLTFTIPWGFLTSVLLVFGRLSADNELTSMRTCGISISRAAAPVAMLAVGFTAVCLWINLEVAPSAYRKMKESMFQIATNNPLAFFGSDRVINVFPGYKIYVDQNDGNRLHNLHVYALGDLDALKSVVFAREGTLSLEDVAVRQPNGREEIEKQIILKLVGTRYESRNEDHPDDLSKWRVGITIESGPIAVSLKELYDERRKKSGGVGSMEIRELLSTESAERGVELQKRISNALATLAFALLGLPLAITAHRKETSVGFVISLAIALLYYFFFFVVDLARSRPHLHPELLIWVPNVVFIAIGALRFARLARQ